MDKTTARHGRNLRQGLQGKSPAIKAGNKAKNEGSTEKLRGEKETAIKTRKEGRNLRQGLQGKSPAIKAGNKAKNEGSTEKLRGAKGTAIKTRKEGAKTPTVKAKQSFAEKMPTTDKPSAGKLKARRKEALNEGFSKQKRRESSKERFGDKGVPRKSKPDFEKRGTGKHTAGIRLKHPKKNEEQGIRLNKYIANAGVCSRREADTLIQNGAIMVNNQIITQMGFKVKPGDVVKYGDQKLNNERKVYLLLNKPKDYITTLDDPQKRKTVMDLVRNACRERLFPVGRLDRNTTGLLLFTNDGDLAKKLTHPRHRIRKIYHVHLEQSLSKADLEKVARGIDIDGTIVVPDVVSYIESSDSKKEVGIELHSGQNRVVRRIFELLGYKVAKLDRVVFAGLTKKDLPRGKWRFLTEKEVSYLNMLG
ncbi:MAG TPA: pseudouridine synthase [Bacteroidales bacterium]|nr:pseudouridine synthase [Bacteroidales bacterium]